MLNEIWHVLDALERASIKLKIPHPLVQPLPASGKNLLRVRLNKDGNVISVEDITSEEKVSIKRIVKAADGSFPVIKVNQPLLKLSAASDIWGKLNTTRNDQGRINLMKDALNAKSYRKWSEAGWHWADSLRKADVLINIIKDNETCKDMKEIGIRFKKALEDDTALVVSIATLALKEIQAGRLGAIKTVQELLIGKGKDNRGKDKKISVLLILELDNNNSIHQGQVWEFLSEHLPTNLAATQRDYQHSASSSAYGGNDALLEEPFSAVKLPVLGARFPLISMASSADKAKCNKRYGLTEYTICPVTAGQCRRMAGALEWLVATKRKGKTWQGMPSGRFEMDARTHKKKEKQDLLIVYVSEMPDVDIKTASYFGTGAEITEAQFEVDAKAVCDALQSIERSRPKSKLNLFLIRKASEGQAQIVLSESLTVKAVLEGAERWQSGAGNIPEIKIYLPAARLVRETIAAVDNAIPHTPYLDQVVRLLSRQWVRGGASPKGNDGKLQKAAQELPGPGLAEVLVLMLKKEGKWQEVAEQMLAVIRQRTVPLLIGLFGARHAFGPRSHLGSHEPAYDYPRESCEYALRAISLMGILLDYLGHRKEIYMKGAAFQIGQVLALADTIHKDYCVVVRQGQMPNTLIGTSLMRRAMDNPTSALADLSERMMEYVRWAKVAQIPNDWSDNDQRRIAVNEVRKRLRQYQPLADNLGQIELPKESNDVMKAQLLLGFLASPPADTEKTITEEESI